MAEYILGIATMGNSAAALFEDNKLIAAVEEERLSRIKNDSGFPQKSIKEVLAIGGITLADVSQICVYWKPWRIDGRLWGTAKKAFVNSEARKSLLQRATKLLTQQSNEENQEGSWADLFFIKKRIKNIFGDFDASINFIDHHLTHQLYAESMQDWDDFVSLSYDGGGEVNSTVVSLVVDGKRKIISKHRWPNSLGHFYSTFTGFLGFKMLEGEYKMMGLAPYGDPKFKDLILEKVLKLDPTGHYSLNTRICDYHEALEGRFNSQMVELFGEPRDPNEKPSKHHIDLAASVQAAHEEALMCLLRPVVKQNQQIDKLVVSGGCALNVTANGKLLSENLFKEIIIPPAPHDSGCAIGACLAVMKNNHDRDSVRSPYMGREFTQAEIEAALNTDGLPKVQPCSEDELINVTAGMLADGKIIAWFQGGSEFGPRALGSRSFLADPRRDEIREEINQKIKKRELFRPFAPSATIEDQNKFFELDQASPYMNIVSKVKNDSIPAVTHIDSTARVHTVSSKSNHIYHRLISKFGELTGVPVLLNTSFNIQEPIVYSPQDAVNTFMASGVDALVIGNFVIRRNA